MRRGVLLAGAFAPFAFLFAGDGKPAKTSFATDVAPIMKAHCVSCHSGESAAGGLDLSSPAGFRKGGRGGVLWNVANPKASLLMQRIRGVGGARMPMGFAPLSADETAKIETWISEGASFTGSGGKHWAYVPPEKAAPPALGSPWIRNPIDAFVLDRLKREGLRPAAEASKETLLRRVTLDLTGLPPTPKEIDAFLADARPDAYERAVDRLLASPHYGEHMAIGWLDLARYADSDGYEKDLRRTAWKWRDWVIDAFNQNMPYDRFTVEQLAGDLLPNATLSQRVATGFHRNTMFNREGGVDQEEAHFAVILDRVDTTSTVWLGSTLACARCHDHKYDPFSQKDYYRMAAIFSNTKVIPRGPKEISEEKWFEPEISVPTAEQSRRQAALRERIFGLEAKLRERNPALDEEFARWKASALRPTEWTVPAGSAKGSAAMLTKQADGSFLASGSNPLQDDFTVDLEPSGGAVSGMRLEVLPDPSFVNRGPGRADNGNFVLTGVEVSADGKPVAIREARADFVQSGYDPQRLVAKDRESGWAIAGGEGSAHEAVFTFANVIPPGAKIRVALEHRSRWPRHTIGRFRLSLTSAPDPGASLMPAKVKGLLQKPVRTPDDEAALRQAFLDVVPELTGTRKGLQEARSELQSLEAQVPTAPVLVENPRKGPLTAFVRRRGEFMSKTEEVVAGTPAVLTAAKPAGDVDRLALARWLVRRDNPLTARVEVNRLWESVFGRGLVETSEDFGTRGAAPSHPELLDWLACEFMDSGWNVKHMVRLIVTSSTYRQSSKATPNLIAKDPQNILLAHGPRFRLPAEEIRDATLAASGLLSPKIGGPSVYPYQPDGIWDSPYSGENWMPSQGEDRFRRSLYTFWKRTAPYPSFMAFDATSRESCTVRRIRTNTPLQALALLNDESMMGAARALAGSLSGKSDAERLTDGFRRCTGRRPAPTETARLTALLNKLRARYARDAKAAQRFGGAETAAWTLVGNVLLNLDETITKG